MYRDSPRHQHLWCFHFALVLLRSSSCSNDFSNVKDCSEADMDSLMTEDEWETLRLGSTDGGLAFRTLMIRPLCVCVCVCVCGLIWPQSCTKTVLKLKCNLFCCLKTYFKV